MQFVSPHHLILFKLNQRHSLIYTPLFLDIIVIKSFPLPVTYFKTVHKSPNLSFW
jgi:hypothetical protein